MLQVVGEDAVDHLSAANDAALVRHSRGPVSRTFVQTLNYGTAMTKAEPFVYAAQLTTTPGRSWLRPTAITGPRILRIGGGWDW